MIAAWPRYGHGSSWSGMVGGPWSAVRKHRTAPTMMKPFDIRFDWGQDPALNEPLPGCQNGGVVKVCIISSSGLSYHDLPRVKSPAQNVDIDNYLIFRGIGQVAPSSPSHEEHFPWFFVPRNLNYFFRFSNFARPVNRADSDSHF
jgi:hypothetical protein